MSSKSGYDRYLEETLKMHIADVLASMEEDTELFETLLCSYPSRFRAVKMLMVVTQIIDYIH